MFDAIYLSPHLDDAALSCGGRIFQQTAVGQKILIVSIMAGDPDPAATSAYAHMLHERWQLAQDVVAARRAEDAAACQLLGAEFLHLTIPDCVYRFNPENGQALYPDWPQITGPIHAAEEPLVQTLAAQLANLPPHRELIVPLTIGNHVDHQIVRQAAERSFGQTLVYYEDYPYSADETAFTAVIPKQSQRWQCQQIPLSADAVKVKINSIAAFTSQLSTFFNGRADLEQKISAHTAKLGGERYWTQKRSGQTA